MKTSFWGRYLSFSGRVKRLSFLLRFIFLLIISIGLIIISAMLAASIPVLFPPTAFGVILLLLVILLGITTYVLTLVAWYSLQVRRLHDINRSGLWVLLFFALGFIGGGTNASNPYDISTLTQIIGLIQLLYLLGLFFWPGTKGPNRFGQDPKWQHKDYAEAVFGEAGNSRYYQRQIKEDDYLPEVDPPSHKDFQPMAHSKVTGGKGTKLAVTRKPGN